MRRTNGQAADRGNVWSGRAGNREPAPDGIGRLGFEIVRCGRRHIFAGYVVGRSEAL